MDVQWNFRGGDISQKIKILRDKYSSLPMILNENIGKTLISKVSQNLSKAFLIINHQLLILASNSKVNFYNTFKTDTNRT